MDDRLLAILETLESSNSISDAAKKLYLTQPYLSRIIKKHEQRYHVLLVNRDSYPVQLTPAGHLLIKYLRKNLQLEGEFREKIKNYEKNNFATLRMGITPPLGQNFNLVLLPKLFSKFPNLKTQTTELSTTDAIKAFKDGQLDLFVGNKISLPHVANQNLYEESQVLVINQKSALYQTGKQELKLSVVELQKLNHENYIVVDGQRGYQEIINNFFSDIGITFYPRIHVRDSSTALKLANLGLGDMTIGIEAVENKAYQNINYVVLPPTKIKVSFSISTISYTNRLKSEINHVKKVLQEFFTSQILVT